MADAVAAAVREHRQRGTALFKEDRFAEAAQCYAEAIGCGPDGPTLAVLLSNRSACYLSLRQYERALRDADEAVALRGDWGKAYSRKATALHGLGRRLEARTAAATGLAVDPENAVLRQIAATLSAAEEPEAEEEPEEDDEEAEEHEEGGEDDEESECYEGSLDGDKAPDDSAHTAVHPVHGEYDVRFHHALEARISAVLTANPGLDSSELTRMAAAMSQGRVQQTEAGLQRERELASQAEAEQRGEVAQGDGEAVSRSIKKRRVDSPPPAPASAPAQASTPGSPTAQG